MLSEVLRTSGSKIYLHNNPAPVAGKVASCSWGDRPVGVLREHPFSLTTAVAASGIELGEIVHHARAAAKTGGRIAVTVSRQTDSIALN
jgi:hypothetical protein